MKKTYKNRLPKNMEASSINAKVVDGEIIVEVELKERFQPKDGDFCVDADGNVFIVCTERGDMSFFGAYVGENKDLPHPFYFNYRTYIKGCRYATPEEKVAFLERLGKECHKRWNPETKELEDIRWRAKSGNRYYRVTISGEFEVEECLETKSSISHLDYRCGNYFRTPEAAKKVADQIREIFKNSKAE